MRHSESYLSRLVDWLSNPPGKRRRYGDASTDNRGEVSYDLAEGKDLDAEKIKQLRELLAHGKKPKADDFVKIFAGSIGGDIK